VETKTEQYFAVNEAGGPPDAKYLKLLVLFLVVACPLIGLLTCGTAFELGSDAGVMLSTGRSLSEKFAYEYNFTPQTKYPPVYPGLAAIFFKIFGDSILEPLRIFSLLMFFFGHLFVYSLLRSHFPLWLAASCAAISASTPQFLELAVTKPNSDLPYFAASFATLCLLSALTKRTGKARAFNTAASTILTITAVLLRSIGIALPISIILLLVYYKFAKRQIAAWSLLIPALSGLFANCLWSLWKANNYVEAYPGEFVSNYSRQFFLRDPHQPLLGEASLLEIILRIPHNLVAQLAHVVEMIFRIPWIEPDILIVPLLVFFCMGAVGTVVGFLKCPLLVIYLMGYLSILLLWPFDEGPRFIAPVFPILIALAGMGGWCLLGEIGRLTKK